MENCKNGYCPAGNSPEKGHQLQLQTIQESPQSGAWEPHEVVSQIVGPKACNKSGKSVEKLALSDFPWEIAFNKPSLKSIGQVLDSQTFQPIKKKYLPAWEDEWKRINGRHFLCDVIVTDFNCFDFAHTPQDLSKIASLQAKWST